MSFFFISMIGKMKTKKNIWRNRKRIVWKLFTCMKTSADRKKIFSFSPYFIHRLTRSKIFFHFFLAIKIVNYLLHCDVTSILTVVEFEETLSGGLRSVHIALLRKYWNPYKWAVRELRPFSSRRNYTSLLSTKISFALD